MLAVCSGMADIVLVWLGIAAIPALRLCIVVGCVCVWSLLSLLPVVVPCVSGC